MNTRSIVSALLTATFCLFISQTAIASEKPAEKRVIDPRVNRVVDYLLPYADDYMSADLNADETSRRSLGSPRSLAWGSSPGIVIGDTWYEYQHNGSMGRMIDRGETDGKSMIHMAWMRLPENDAGIRKYEYNFYNATTGTLAVSYPVEDYWAGYVGIDVTGDNRAVVGGHEKPAVTFAPKFYWDATSGGQYFGLHINRLPDSVMAFGGPLGAELMWPKFRYQETAPDTVTHVIAQFSSYTSDPQYISYFRKVGLNELGSWDYPPYVIDTVFDLAHDIAASRTSGKVALVWAANITGSTACDTNSGEQPFIQLDNDIYYQVSNDQGLTWEPRVNVTCNVDGEAGYRPYADLNVLIASDDNLHIVWSGRVWPSDANSGGSTGIDCSIFHWSEDVPMIRKVHDAEWDQTTCNGGVWQMNVSKMTISECDGRFYCLFVQFNDIPNGIEDDCAKRGIDGTDRSGSANGELWLSVSSNNGANWDEARNLTNSYSPNCDSLNGTYGPCDSDHWPSMTRFGQEIQPGEDWSGAETIDPSNGEYAGNAYLDIQWIHDPDAGGIVQDEGTWQLADVHWARIPCVNPTPNPIPEYSLDRIEYPTWGPYGQQFDTNFAITNHGNVDLSYTIAVIEDNTGGVPAGWLTYSGLSGVTPAGLTNTENGQLHLNSGGIVTHPIDGPTTVLKGMLIFTGNAPSFPDTIPIMYYVADTLLVPIWDTLSGSCFALTISNNGNIGNNGEGKVTLDYFDYGDCDMVDSIPGWTDVYLYSGSPVIAMDNGSDTAAYRSMYNTDYLDNSGYRTITEHTLADMGTHYEFYSGVFTTADTTIGLEQTTFMPNGNGNDCFIIQCLKVYSYDGKRHNGLSIGQAVDWDVPSDSLNTNTSGFDPSRNLIFQIGAEFDQDNALECLDNDSRLGGLAFLEKFHKDYEQFVAIDTLYVYTALSTSNNGLATLQANIDAASAWYTANIITVTDGNTVQDDSFVGAYTLDNPTWVYPDSGFVAAELYGNMRTQNELEQFETFTDSVTDLHTVMTFVNDFELGGLGCCQGIRGNANSDLGDHTGVSDVSYLVSWLFGIPSGPAPNCIEEANADGDLGERVNVADVAYLVAWLFGIPSGPAPPPCP